MAWSERQRAMLEAMGVRVWTPRAEADAPRSPTMRASAPEHEIAAAPVSVIASADLARDAPARGPETIRGTVSAPVAAPAARPAVASGGVSALAAADLVPASALDWPALAQAVAECRACGLCQGRKQAVFGVGDPAARWMIVGEAPGEQEDLLGEPFVGPSGQLLDQMLRALRLTRSPGTSAEQVFIANTVKCRPPRNRNPEPGEIAQCAPFLDRQIALVQPRVLLALGAVAAKALLSVDEPLGRLRGRVHDRGGTPVVVTYHPAYLLRQPSEKAKAWDDLCLAAETVARGDGDGMPRTR